MRYVSIVLLALLAAGCTGAGSLDVSDRLAAHREDGCVNGPASDRHGLSGGNCADFSAGERDLYIDWAHDH